MRPVGSSGGPQYDALYAPSNCGALAGPRRSPGLRLAVRGVKPVALSRSAIFGGGEEAAIPNINTHKFDERNLKKEQNG